MPHETKKKSRVLLAENILAENPSFYGGEAQHNIFFSYERNDMSITVSNGLNFLHSKLHKKTTTFLKNLFHADAFMKLEVFKLNSCQE